MKDFTARWELTIPAVPPTLNHAYIHARGKRIKTDEYRSFEALVRHCINVSKQPIWEENTHLMMQVFLYSPKVYRKRRKGETRPVFSHAFGDTVNREKHLTDSIFKVLNRDDVHVKSTFVDKDDDGQGERTHVTIEWEI
jgi:hypothetical protein